MSKPSNPMILRGVAKNGNFTAVTLRDLFAAAAMAGMSLPHDYSHGTHNSSAANRAYCLADAMLAEREKESGDDA